MKSIDLPGSQQSNSYFDILLLSFFSISSLFPSKFFLFLFGWSWRKKDIFTFQKKIIKLKKNLWKSKLKTEEKILKGFVKKTEKIFFEKKKMDENLKINYEQQTDKNILQILKVNKFLSFSLFFYLFSLNFFHFSFYFLISKFLTHFSSFFSFFLTHSFIEIRRNKWRKWLNKI